jgi:hypothetical protein
MSFENKIIEAIDEAFNSIGNDCTQTIYDYLDRNFMLTRLNIPKRIEDFSEAMDKIFGFGAKIVKIRIIKNLYQKMEKSIGYTNDETLDFVDYIQSIRNSNILCVRIS